MTVAEHEDFFEFLKYADPAMLFEYFHAIYTVQVLDLVNTAMVAIVVHEYFAHLAAEMRTWKLLFEGRFMPARMAVILIRYAWIGAYVNCMIFLHGSPKPEACIIHFRLVYGLYVPLWAASGSIFLMRLNIIFGRQRSIMAGYVALWLFGLGCWIYVVTRLGAGPLPTMLQQPYGPKCVTKRFPKIGALGWGASILFDCSVFMGTLYRFHVTAKAQDKTTQLRSRKWLFRSNLYYFGSSMFFNIACLFSNLFVNDVVLSQVGTPIAFAMHTVTASRLVFNAKGWARGDTLGDEDDVILNTFNRNRRDNPTGRIMYTVDETVITSVGGTDSMHAPGRDEKEGNGDDDDSSHTMGGDTKNKLDDQLHDVENGTLHKDFYDNGAASLQSGPHQGEHGFSSHDGYGTDESGRAKRTMRAPELRLHDMSSGEQLRVPSPSHFGDMGQLGSSTGHADEPLAVRSPIRPIYSCDTGLRCDDEPEQSDEMAAGRSHPYSTSSQLRSPRLMSQLFPHAGNGSSPQVSEARLVNDADRLQVEQRPSILRKTSGGGTSTGHTAGETDYHSASSRPHGETSRFHAK